MNNSSISTVLKKFPQWLIISTAMVYACVSLILVVINYKIKMPQYKTHLFYFTSKTDKAKNILIFTNQLALGELSGKKIKMVIYCKQDKPPLYIQGIVTGKNNNYFKIKPNKSVSGINPAKQYFGELTVLNDSKGIAEMILKRIN